MPVKIGKSLNVGGGFGGDAWVPMGLPTDKKTLAKAEEYGNGWCEDQEVLGRIESRHGVFGEDETRYFLVERFRIDDGEELERLDAPELLLPSNGSLNKMLAEVNDGAILLIQYKGTTIKKNPPHKGSTVHVYDAFPVEA